MMNMFLFIFIFSHRGEYMLDTNRTDKAYKVLLFNISETSPFIVWVLYEPPSWKPQIIGSYASWLELCYEDGN